MLMFLDESAANEQIMNRRHEWASFDISFSIIRSVKRSERWSILSVYCIDEILTSHIHQKSIIETRFEWFLREEILSKCNAFLESKSILIMNNVFIHHVEISEIDWWSDDLTQLIELLENQKSLSRSRCCSSLFIFILIWLQFYKRAFFDHQKMIEKALKES
jgi:hypothetical protein